MPYRKYQAKETAYLDTGCKKAKELRYEGICLNCPFPVCLEEVPYSYLKYGRNAKIMKLHDCGITTKEIAHIYGKAERTIQRIIAQLKATDP